jgi:dihydroorotase
VDFVLTENSFVAATITPHHLLLNRSDLLLGGLNPHHFCLPILKSAEDQRAIIEAAISGNPKFFAGTDSAPHLLSRKQGGIAPAGIFNAPVAMAVYAQVFEDHHALDRLENFCSVYGAHFYTLPLNTKQIRLTRSPWQVPPSIPLPSNESLVPMYAGKTLHWQWEAMT